MNYSSIDLTNATELTICDENVVFVDRARNLAPSLRKIVSYTSDDYGLYAHFIPAVFRDPTSLGYLAGYRIVASLADADRSDANVIIDRRSLFTDSMAAALAADGFTDAAATAARAMRPEPTDGDWSVIRERSRGALGNGNRATTVRRRCPPEAYGARERAQGLLAA